MNSVDKVPVPFGFGIEVMAERAIYEYVYGTSETYEFLAFKSLHQQRQNVLSANTFEALCTAIPILIALFVPV